MPEKFDPIGLYEVEQHKSYSSKQKKEGFRDYERTQKLAKALSVERPAQVIVERGLVETPTALPRRLVCTRWTLGRVHERNMMTVIREHKGAMIWD